MKKYTLVLITIVAIFSKNSFSQSSNDIIGKILHEEDWYELGIQYPKLKGEITPLLDYISQVMLGIANYNQKQGISAIDSLLKNDELQSELGFENVCNLVILKTQLYADKFQYKEALNLLDKFIPQAKGNFSEHLKTTFESVYEHYNVLSKQKTITITQPSVDTYINCHTVSKNNKSLLCINCDVNGEVAEMIFDTGSPGFSLVSEKFAKKYRIKKIADEMQINGVGKGNAWIGIADSLNFGNVVCYNPIFYVVPSIMPEKAVEEGAIDIEAILGSNILFEIGEFQYLPKRNKIVLPAEKTQLPQSGQNLFMRDDRHQYVQAFADGQKLPLHLDIGSARTCLSSAFYFKYKDWITNNCKKDSTSYVGFGGVSNQEIYRMPVLNLNIGSNKYELKDVEIQTEKSHNIWDGAGFIGFDFISACNKVTVSYEKMFIEIE